MLVVNVGTSIGIILVVHVLMRHHFGHVFPFKHRTIRVVMVVIVCPHHELLRLNGQTSFRCYVGIW